MNVRELAQGLIRGFKGGSYVFGLDCLDHLGALAARFGKRCSVVAGGFGRTGGEELHKKILASLSKAELKAAGDIIRGPAPNAPYEDVRRILDGLRQQRPDCIISVGGGSCIDAVKAAAANFALDGVCNSFEDFFGIGQVSRALAESGRKLLPHVASITASGAASHLTKYSNVTDMRIPQKMLIIDDALVPPAAHFDYSTTLSSPAELTMDGAFDGVSHCLEVYMGLPPALLAKGEPFCLTGIELLINNVKKAVADPADREAREALGLGTDLGGIAIMIGGTSGGHLTSFSLVDLLPHGRACALMNPYYLVFFAPAIEGRLRKVGEIYRRAGHVRGDLSGLRGRDLGIAVAEGMMKLSAEIGFPTKLSQLKGFTDAHIGRCLQAAKNPRLESKLRNMPVPLSAELVDEYMGAILRAAKAGDLNMVREMR